MGLEGHSTGLVTHWWMTSILLFVYFVLWMKSYTSVEHLQRENDLSDFTLILVL